MIDSNLFLLPPNASPEEILKLSKLDWRVTLCPRYFNYEGQFAEVDNGYSLVNCETWEELTIATGKWQPSQNSEVIEVFHRFAQDSELPLLCAGGLNGGRQICVIADLGAEHDVKNVGDISHCYLQLIGSHQCGIGHQVRLLVERLVCTNGITRRVTQHKQTLRHVPNALQTLQQALILAHQEWEELIGEYELMADTPMDSSQAALLLIKSFGDPEKDFNDQPPVVQCALRLFEGELIGGHFLSAYRTAYGLLQSVTEYFGHHHRFRKSTDSFASCTIGSVANQVARFERQLVRVCNHG